MRLMKIIYTNETDVNRLKTCLDMCAIKYVVHKDYEFIGGGAKYVIFIDKNKCTWNEVIREINRVHSVKMKYVNNMEIRNGLIYEEV